MEHSLEKATAKAERGSRIVAAGSGRSRVARKSIAVPLLLWLGAVALVFTLVRPVVASEIVVMSSGGFTAALRGLAKDFAQLTGHHVVIVLGPSMGEASTAIPVRLARGENADVLVMVGDALDGLIERGLARAAGRIDLAKSKIGMAVRSGAPLPDIGTVELFRSALLTAKSLAYSDSASGVYIAREMYQRLGLESVLLPKSRMIVAEPVGEVVARGEAEIGFQQISELLPVAGIQFVGPIPQDFQKVTTFSAGVAAKAKESEVAEQFIGYLASATARPAIAATGMEPIGR
ncbi:substrate-binding domain-containing protein [Rubrivivax sp. JA1024]|nr:substrate-binding domain-containing protein [Rubrivivax sp. JA1024]